MLHPSLCFLYFLVPVILPSLTVSPSQVQCASEVSALDSSRFPYGCSYIHNKNLPFNQTVEQSGPPFIQVPGHCVQKWITKLLNPQQLWLLAKIGPVNTLPHKGKGSYPSSSLKSYLQLMIGGEGETPFFCSVATGRIPCFCKQPSTMFLWRTLMKLTRF